MPLRIETTEDATRLLDEIDRASSVARLRITGSLNQSPWGRGAYSASPHPLLPRSINSQPSGIIVHYTASPSAESSVAWFCKPLLKSERSAHYVVAQDRTKLFSADELSGFGMLKQLPALPILCRDPRFPGVHATWCNGWTVGIELVNLGCDTASSLARARALAPACGRTWEKYSDAQIETVTALVRALRLVLPSVGLDTVLGHELVQSSATPGVLEDKRDPGPLFPWSQFRRDIAIRRDPPANTTIPDHLENMEKLGYYVRNAPQTSVRIFQYMMGLTVDGIAGPKTQAAVANRLIDRGFRGMA